MMYWKKKSKNKRVIWKVLRGILSNIPYYYYYYYFQSTSTGSLFMRA